MRASPVGARLLVPLFADPICAGFPSPAEDYLDDPVDLSQILAPNRPATFLFPVTRAVGGDGSVMLVAQRGLRPRPGDTVAAWADGEQVVATVGGRPGDLRLADLSGRQVVAAEVVAMGVATWALRSFRGPVPEPQGLDFGFLVTNRPATFMFVVDGWSMREAGIGSGDTLIVDRSLMPRHGDVVVAVVDGARSVKRLLVEGGHVRLAFENEAYPEYRLPAQAQASVFGVVTWAMRRTRPPSRRGRAPGGRR